MLEKKVIKVEDLGKSNLPVPPAEDALAEYGHQFQGRFRQDIKPLVISQPEGPSFEVDGYQVRWQGFSLHLGFTAREGLVLYNVTHTRVDPLTNTVETRPIIWRAAFTEMVVPYGDPTPPNVRKNAFDAGEDGLGNSANSLTLGCDCLGCIRYFDVFLLDKYVGRAASALRPPVARDSRVGPRARARARAGRGDAREERHLPARGGRRRAVEAPGLAHRRRRDPARPPPGGVVHGLHLQLHLRCARASRPLARPAPLTRAAGFYYIIRMDGSFHFQVMLTGVVNTSSLLPEVRSLAPAARALASVLTRALACVHAEHEPQVWHAGVSDAERAHPPALLHREARLCHRRPPQPRGGGASGSQPARPREPAAQRVLRAEDAHCQ
jgi:hypothetical protein